MEKKEVKFWAVWCVALGLGFILGLMIGQGVTMYKFIDSAEVTVDINESNIMPIMLDWFEKNGYLPDKEEMQQINVTALNKALQK